MRAILLLSIGLGLVGACDFFDRGDPPDDNSRGVGQGCEVTSQCRANLVCEGTCQPSGMVTMGAPCQLSGECVDGLYCGPARTCVPAGEGGDGDSCNTTGDCESGLVCALEGFYARCRAPGEGDLTDTCAVGGDCLAGLTCVHAPGATSGSCQSVTGTVGGEGGELPPSAPFWPGVTCEASTGPARAYFEVPRHDGMDGDFYRLPFPNDVRTRAGGAVDLRGHPSPDTSLDVNLIDRYLREAERDLHGFSMNPVVYFRFSQPYDWDSVPSAIRFVDVDPESEHFGEGALYAWLTTFGQITRYICEDWVGIRTVHGAPLRPGTTYAVILTRDLDPAPDVGGNYERDADFEVMMADAAPGDETLAEAWAHYQPLRDYLAGAEDLSADDVLSATVFTTEPLRDMAAMRETVRAEALPTLQDATVCAPGVTSPCDDETLQRACPEAATPGLVEIHGRLSLPVFQEGERPYAEPADGGAIEWRGGAPVVQGSEDVCVTITVPEGVEAPETGWPVILAAHGTGGSMRTAVNSGLALEAATTDVDGAPLAAATIGIDLPMHGARRGSDGPPDELFFNVLNPAAARDNVLQGAGDLFGLVRYAQEADEVVDGHVIRFDPSRVALFAHSQGATHADLVVPYESGLAAVIFSGNGGDLTLSLLTKTSPRDIAALVPFALMDADGAGNLPAGDFHPALALFQMMFDVSDPVNYARALVRDVPADVTMRHVMMAFGNGDTFTTNDVQRAYAAAAGLPHVAPRALDLNLGQADSGLSGNVSQGDLRYTVGMRSYDPPEGVDGHFVTTLNDDGRADTRRFLVEALTGTVPTL